MKAPLFDFKVDRKQVEYLHKKAEDEIDITINRHNTVGVESALDSTLAYSNTYVSTTNTLQEQIDELKAQVKRKRIKKITIKL